MQLSVPLIVLKILLVLLELEQCLFRCVHFLNDAHAHKIMCDCGRGYEAPLHLVNGAVFLKVFFTAEL